MSDNVDDRSDVASALQSSEDVVVEKRDPKAIFYQEMLKMIASKKCNVVIKSKKDYDIQIAAMMEANMLQKKDLSNSQKYFISKFSLLTIGDTTKIIRKKESEKEKPKIYAFLEEIYDIIKAEHERIGHKARLATFEKCKESYENITQEAVTLFLTTCFECERSKRKNTTTNLVSQPIRSSEYLARWQVDLIDCQSFPDGKYKWIMVVQDHFTKAIHLRPLERKIAAAVAWNLLDIMLTDGAPVILQSDNGKEFVASVIKELKILWPDLHIIHGRPRHPQSQGSVERANGIVKTLLGVWMRTNQKTNWSLGIKFVQFQYNIAYNRHLKMSPFKAKFGIDAPIGLAATCIPSEKWTQLSSEKDLNLILKSMILFY